MKESEISEGPSFNYKSNSTKSFCGADANSLRIYFEAYLLALPYHEDREASHQDHSRHLLDAVIGRFAQVLELLAIEKELLLVNPNTLW